MATFHNKYGLMGAPPGNTEEVDRSEVLPFSVMTFDEEEGWFQYGVYETREKAVRSAEEQRALYHCKTTIADTNAILDMAEASNDPWMELPESCMPKPDPPEGAVEIAIHRLQETDETDIADGLQEVLNLVRKKEGE